MRHYLKELRAKANLTQQETADKMEMSQNYYCSIENGGRQQNMDIGLAQKLAKIFDVSVEYIIEEENKLKEAR